MGSIIERLPTSHEMECMLGVANCRRKVALTRKSDSKSLQNKAVLVTLLHGPKGVGASCIGVKPVGQTCFVVKPPEDLIPFE
jgi:hypothetical protein